nr:PREDICTED: alpha-1D adrenergic receptor [Equus przewalskii]
MEVLGFWAFGRAFCDVWAAVDVLCCTASILSLCTISVDRYVGVRHSLKYPAIMTERKAAAILALLWAVALVVSVGPLLGWKEPVPPDERFCGITEEAGYAVFSSVCSFYLPMAVIVVMYCRVYVVARSTTRSLEAGVKRERGKASEVVLRIHCRGASLGADGAHGMRSAKGHTFRSSLSVRLLKFSREKKAAKTLAIVVGVFVLCWFPFFFVLPLDPGLEGVLSIAMGHNHFLCGLSLSQTLADPQRPEPCPNLLHELTACHKGPLSQLKDLPALASAVVTRQNRVLGPSERHGWDVPAIYPLPLLLLRMSEDDRDSDETNFTDNLVKIFLREICDVVINTRAKVSSLSHKIRAGSAQRAEAACALRSEVEAVSLGVPHDVAEGATCQAYELADYSNLRETDI